MSDTNDTSPATTPAPEAALSAMLRKTRRLSVTMSIAAILLPAVVLAGIWAWNVYTRHRVEWWLEHSYSMWRGLIPEANLYFPSYEKWSEAGRKIPGIERILIDKYAVASLREKRHLLYAMGAVPTPRTLSFLSDVALSTNDPELRTTAVWMGLGPNLAEGQVQETYLALLENHALPPKDHLSLLCALIEAGNASAIGYPKAHSEEVVAELEREVPNPIVREKLFKTLGLPHPASGPTSRPSSEPRPPDPARGSLPESQ